jgi:HPt (histidine-containing phosphotransfer) domain-containing protein
MTEEQLLNMITELSKEMGMDPDDLLELYETFIEEMTADLFKLKIAYQKGDFVELKNVSHNIKGVSASLKFEEMFIESKSLNDKLKADSVDNLYPHIDAMTKAFNSFKLAFTAYHNH